MPKNWATDNIHIGQRLKWLREGLRLSQGEFAEQLSISLAGYGNYENGKRSLSSKMLVELAEETGLSPSWLLLGTGEVWMPGKAPNLSDQPRLKSVLPVFPDLSSPKGISHEKPCTSGGVDALIHQWLEEWWQRSSGKEKIWFEVQFEQAFPQYLHWLREKQSVAHNFPLDGKGLDAHVPQILLTD